MPQSRYKADNKDPFQRRHSVWLKTSDASEKSARAYDTAARRYHGHKAVTKFPQDNLRDFLEKSSCKNVNDDNNDNSNLMLQIQTNVFRSSFERGCGGANNDCSTVPLNLEITLALSKSM